MGPLRASLAAACLAFATPAHAEVVSDWRSYTAEASARFGVPVEWIEAVMQAESGGQTRLRGRPIRSSAGAMGLMQLMPGTWADMRRSEEHTSELQSLMRISYAVFCLKKKN